MSIIPGLSFVPADEQEAKYELGSLTGSFCIPESHLSGNCRQRSALVKDLVHDRAIIHKGSKSNVIKCIDPRNKQIYGLKKFNFSDQDLRNGMPISFLRQINILKLLKHPHIVNWHEAVVEKNLADNFMLLDYCIVNLDQLIKQNCEAIFENDVVKYMMRQLFDGISYLHKHTVIHRNISSGNVHFTAGGVLKMGGFRTTRFYSKDYMRPEETELVFCAPELLLEAHYGMPIDLWAAGCILARLLLKRQLIEGDSKKEVLISIFQLLGTPSEVSWPGYKEIHLKAYPHERLPKNTSRSTISKYLCGVPQFQCQLILDLLMLNPDFRMSAPEALKSPYFQESLPECSPNKMVSILKEVCPIEYAKKKKDKESKK